MMVMMMSVFFRSIMRFFVSFRNFLPSIGRAEEGRCALLCFFFPSLQRLLFIISDNWIKQTPSSHHFANSQQRPKQPPAIFILLIITIITIFFVVVAVVGVVVATQRGEEQNGPPDGRSVVVNQIDSFLQPIDPSIDLIDRSGIVVGVIG